MTKEEFTELRQKAGFSKQLDLAKHLGITDTTLSTWVNNDKVPEHIIKSLHVIIENRYLKAAIEILKN